MAERAAPRVPAVSDVVTLMHGSGHLGPILRTLHEIPAIDPPGCVVAVKRRHQRENALAVVTMKQLLESGVHFGHQARRWNPKMKKFIFMERNGIHTIDTTQTLVRGDDAQ